MGWVLQPTDTSQFPELCLCMGLGCSGVRKRKCQTFARVREKHSPVLLKLIRKVTKNRDPHFNLLGRAGRCALKLICRKVCVEALSRTLLPQKRGRKLWPIGVQFVLPLLTTVPDSFNNTAAKGKCVSFATVSYTFKIRIRCSFKKIQLK